MLTEWTAFGAYITAAAAVFTVAVWLDRRRVRARVAGVRLARDLSQTRWLTVRNPNVYVAVVALIILQCGGGTYGGGTMGCEMFPHRPHISKGHYKDFGELNIVAKVTYRCRVQVTAHSIKMKLQLQRGKRWRTMARATDDQIPPGGGKKKATSQVAYDGCKTGTWRIRVTGSNIYNKKTYKIGPFTGTGWVDCSRPPET